jgi:hypothetical protein
MSIRPDGSVRSSNIPSKKSFFKNEYQNSSNIHRGIVVGVLYADDPKNVTVKSENPVVLYEVLVLTGELAGQMFTNVRKMENLGGEYSYSEHVLRAMAENTEFSGAGGKKVKETQGDVVILGFLGGQKRNPIILGGEKSPKNSDTSAKKADGPRKIEEYNGIRTEINKDGEFKLVQKGGSFQAKEGFFKPNERSSDYESTIEMKDESLIIVFKSGMRIVMDAKNDSVILETKDGSNITVEGNKISLSGSSVEVGSSAAFSAVLFENLQAAFNTHIHNAPQAPSGVLPTTPPTVPMMPNVGSTSVKVKN